MSVSIYLIMHRHPTVNGEFPQKFDLKDMVCLIEFIKSSSDQITPSFLQTWCTGNMIEKKLSKLCLSLWPEESVLLFRNQSMHNIVQERVWEGSEVLENIVWREVWYRVHEHKGARLISALLQDTVNIINTSQTPRLAYLLCLPAFFTWPCLFSPTYIMSSIILDYDLWSMDLVWVLSDEKTDSSGMKYL